MTTTTDPAGDRMSTADILADVGRMIDAHDRAVMLREIERLTDEIGTSRRARMEHEARKMRELLGNRATLARIARMTGAERPASHLRIVGEDEGVARIDTPAEQPKSEIQRIIDETDEIMERVRRRRDRMMGLDPDRPLATVVSLDDRRQVKR